MIINGTDYSIEFEELRDKLHIKIDEIDKNNLVIVLKDGNFHKAYCRGQELKFITNLRYFVEYDNIPTVDLTVLKPRIIEL